MTRVRVSHGPSSIATIGYEGHDLSTFIGTLQKKGIRQLVDVRELPLSRKRGFSKSSLSAALAEKGITYLHYRALGAPRDVRHELREDGDFGRFSEAYLAHLSRERGAMDDLKIAAAATPTAIMCVEKDPACCHRGLIGRRLRSAGFEIVHLR
jgi:uncharacterized protein (DUF488 family)